MADQNHNPVTWETPEDALDPTAATSSETIGPCIAKLEHALELMSHVDNFQYRTELEGLLRDCLRSHPDEPDLQMWLGLVVEVNGDIAAARQLYEDAKKAYEKRLALQDDSEANLNRAIALYRLGDAYGLDRCVTELHDCNVPNPYVWFTWSYFLVVLGRFNEALKCLHAREVPVTMVREVQALRGLILEGLQRYDEAIALLQDLLRTGLSPAAEAETHHVLAHALVERRKGGDVTAGDAHMRLAADLNPDYLLCLAVIHSETKRFRQAVAIFDQALNDPATLTRPAFRADLRFYRGQAFWGLEEYDLARAEFTAFEAACAERQLTDGVILARMHIVKCDLRRDSIDAISADQLRQMKRQLEEHEPTPFANAELAAERIHLINMLDAYLVIRHLLSTDAEATTDLDLPSVLTRLRAAAATLQHPASSLCVVSFSPPKLDPDSMVPAMWMREDRSVSVLPSELAGSSDEGVVATPESMAGFDLIVLDATDGLTPFHSFVIGSMGAVKSILVVTGSEQTIPGYMRDGIVCVSELETAYALGEVTLLYESLKRDLIDIQPWPGAVYYERTPSLSLSLSNPLPISLWKAINERRCPLEWLAGCSTAAHSSVR